MIASAKFMVGCDVDSIPQTEVPQQTTVCAGVAVGVEGIHAVVFRRHIYDVTCALFWNFHSGNEKRLRINISIHIVLH